MLLLAMTFLKAGRKKKLQQGFFFGFNPSAPDNSI
jgi:hypothetical protein